MKITVYAPWCKVSYKQGLERYDRYPIIRPTTYEYASVWKDEAQGNFWYYASIKDPIRARGNAKSREEAMRLADARTTEDGKAYVL